jgi:hypothetical protein
MALCPFYAVYCPTELKILGTFGARFISLLRAYDVLCPFYTIYYPFHSLAASLRRFMPVKCEHSEAHEREKRGEREALAAILYGFMPVTTSPCGAVGGIGTPVSRLHTLTLAYG